MNQYQKFSRWITEMERTIKEMHREKATVEARIGRKIDDLVVETLQNEFAPLSDRQKVIARLNRMAKLLEAGDNSISTLKEVEKEVDAIYGDQSQNDAYFFGRKSAGEKEVKEMEELSTFDPDWPQHGNVMPEDDHEEVQRYLEKDKKSSWSDFAMSDHYSFEDDGEFIDSDDMLDLDIPSGYEFEQRLPLDDQDF